MTGRFIGQQPRPKGLIAINKKIKSLTPKKIRFSKVKSASGSRLLGDLRKQLGMAVLLITHNLGIVGDLADDVAVMYAGQIVEHGPVREVLQRPLHPYTQALIQSVPDLEAEVERLTAIPGTVPLLGAFPSGCRFHPRCPKAQASCSTQAPALTSIKAGRRVRCPLWDSLLEPQTVSHRA